MYNLRDEHTVQQPRIVVGNVRCETYRCNQRTRIQHTKERRNASRAQVPQVLKAMLRCDVSCSRQIVLFAEKVVDSMVNSSGMFVLLATRAQHTLPTVTGQWVWENGIGF